MLIEILDLAAALEWIALGVLVYLKARSLSRKLDAMCSKLPANYRQVTVGPGPDPVGKKGPWGICPECGTVGSCYWDKKTDTCTCMACGHKDNGTIR